MKFVLTADWHLRGDRPRCRTDEDWVATQMEHVRFVVDLANAQQAPICIVGDVFNTPRVATKVVNAAIAELRRCKYPVLILAGNHDLPYHSYERFDDCSLGTLAHIFPELGSPAAVELIGQHNASPFGCDRLNSEESVVFTHQLVFRDDSDRPMADCGKVAQDVLDEFVNAKWIFTGDYHTAFHYTTPDGRHVVNPGCLNRQVADKMDYDCRVAVVDTTAETVVWVSVPDSAELVQDAYLREAEDTEDRVEAFLELVQARGEVSLSFIDNLEARLQLNEVPPAVRSECAAVLQSIQSGGTK